MIDHEPKPNLGEIMADDALEFVNGPDNPFPPQDARNQILHNLVRPTEQPQTQTPSAKPTDLAGEVEAYLQNPYRQGLSNRQAAEKVLEGQMNRQRARARARKPRLPENKKPS